MKRFIVFMVTAILSLPAFATAQVGTWVGTVNINTAGGFTTLFQALGADSVRDTGNADYPHMLYVGGDRTLVFSLESEGKISFQIFPGKVLQIQGNYVLSATGGTPNFKLGVFRLFGEKRVTEKSVYAEFLGEVKLLASLREVYIVRSSLVWGSMTHMFYRLSGLEIGLVTGSEFILDRDGDFVETKDIVVMPGPVSGPGLWDKIQRLNLKTGEISFDARKR